MTQPGTRLFLIRHAQVEVQPQHDARTWGLSVKGAQQAAQLATLPMWDIIDRIVVSSEPKTRLTVAAVLIQRNLPVTVDARFDELHRPGWVGAEEYALQVQRTFADPAHPAGEWEAATAALVRFRAGIADLCTEFAGATLALVGHGLTFSLYRAHLLGQTHVRFADWQQLSFAAVALVDPVTEKLLQDFQPVAGRSTRSGS